MEVYDYQDCNSDIERIVELLRCGIFEKQNSGSVVFQSAFIELMICLRDLLFKCEKYAERITFSDDILTSTSVTDVTDAVTAVRNACCHIQSGERVADELGSRTVMVSFGKGSLYKSPTADLSADYDDDIAFFYGANRLYMTRHIARAFEEAVDQLRPVMALFCRNPIPESGPESTGNP